MHKQIVRDFNGDADNTLRDEQEHNTAQNTFVESLVECDVLGLYVSTKGILERVWRSEGLDVDGGIIAKEPCVDKSECRTVSSDDSCGICGRVGIF